MICVAFVVHLQDHEKNALWTTICNFLMYILITLNNLCDVNTTFGQ